MKKLMSLLLCAALLCASAIAEVSKQTKIVVHNTEKNGLYITVDGEKVVFEDAQPFIDENNRTMIPLRAVSEIIDGEVSWNPNTMTATVEIGERIVSFTIGSSVMNVNGLLSEMDTTAVIKDNRTFIPARYLGEAFSCLVMFSDSNEIPDGETYVYSNAEDIPLDIRDMLTDGMPEDAVAGIFGGNIVLHENIYHGGNNVPSAYEQILSQDSTVKAEFIGVSEEDYLNNAAAFLSAEAIDLSKGAAELKIPIVENNYYEFESPLLTNHGGSVLIEYAPKNNGTVTEAGIPIYIKAYNGDVYEYSFYVGHIYCHYGQKTVVRIDGLRSDRGYVLSFMATDVSNSDDATVKIISVSE